MNYIFFMFLVLNLLNVNKIYSQINEDLKGIWEGKLIINESVNLSIAFEISEDEDKNIAAVMHSLDQSAFDIAVEEIKVYETNITLIIKSLNSVFSGKIESHDSISGSLAQGKNEAWLLCLNKVDKLSVEKPNRPQEPKKPYPYHVENITYVNESAGVTIAGTLTRPKEEGQYPVVILISGSGPNERDANIFGHKVFLVWADILTRSGIAVLRVDDRGVSESTGKFHSADNRDLADDVVAGVHYLQSRKDIDRNKIGLIGHSLGADIAPIAANKSKDISFIVLMAGAGTSLYDGLLEQCKAIYPTKGVSEYGVDLNHRINVAGFEVVRSESNDSIARLKIAEKMASFNSEVKTLNDHDAKALGLTAPLNPELFYGWLSPSKRFDLFYDPFDYLNKIKCPVLALNGDKDLQVLPHNLTLIEKALKEAGNTNYTIKLWKNKNHLFQTCQSCTVEEYSEIEETIAPEVMDYIIEWIEKL